MSDYNGWTNRETWLVNLWFGELFQDASVQTPDELKDYVLELIEPEMPEGFLADLIDLGVINWRELSEHVQE